MDIFTTRKDGDIMKDKAEIKMSERIEKLISFYGREMLQLKLIYIISDGACQHWTGSQAKERMTDMHRARIRELYGLTDEEIDSLLTD